MSLMLDAGLILLREGLEAVLVLAALAAFLGRAAPERTGALGAGAALGLAASLVVAILYALYLGGEHDDRVEAATCLLAAGLMLWTGGWLARHADPRAWSAALKTRTDRALSGRRVAVAVAAIGFLAVFREGAETVLFLAALGAEQQPIPVLAGAVVAALVLFGFWVVIRRGTRRLPLRPLFLGTSLFLLVMAARFTAAAVQELQEQAFISFTPVDLPETLLAIGIPDSAEALVAFLAVICLAPLALLPRRRPSTTPAAAE
ncbi:iron permease FTR1 [Roseomonas stagni]|uniref:Iron permease FTR1 n=1 Tax=Falsiroseomonas algicola TaxID=2716930 RepID=A0A6M1LMY8_9PROT|nr:FTR1 family protein [Falsiroseomonas algicola]NGM21708.1 iron permease FTR1 [Falsiroseomonas algicola]